MIELSTHVFEVLRKDEEFILYRAQCEELASRVLVLAPAAEYPRPETLKQLEHETPKQIALAWLLKRSPVMLAIPGTLSIEHLEMQAASLRLTDEEYRELTNVSEPPPSFRS